MFGFRNERALDGPGKSAPIAAPSNVEPRRTTVAAVVKENFVFIFRAYEKS